MTVNELFPNPTVKSVIFQIRFPNLFYIESRIGDFQERIMEQFPESELGYQRQLVFADMGPKAKLEDIAKDIGEEGLRKIWQFKSLQGYHLNVLSDALDITSNVHKTYNHPDGEYRFRDVIGSVLDAFFEVVRIPTIARLGLRYIDECPIVEKTSSMFSRYFDSVFPLERFPLEVADEMDFKTVVRKGGYFLRYVESLRKTTEANYALILDFDGFAVNVDSKDVLSHADKIHDMISTEYQASIKQPLIEYMRRPKETT